MFLTQVYGTILGGFVNYAVMISVVSGNRELLRDSNGNSSWSGAAIQSYNTNATSWALAKYLYKAGTEYEMVPIGLGIGFGIVAVHRVFVYVSTRDIISSGPNRTNTSLLPVRPEDQGILYRRNQHAPIYTVCWILTL